MSSRAPRWRSRTLATLHSMTIEETDNGLQLERSMTFAFQERERLQHLVVVEPGADAVIDWDRYHGVQPVSQPRTWDEYHGLPSSELSPPDCTGVAAAWCPRCGDCVCGLDRREEGRLNHPHCPLHKPSSDHAVVLGA